MFIFLNKIFFWIKVLFFVVVVFCSIIKLIDLWFKSDFNYVVVVYCKVCYFKYFLKIYIYFLVDFILDSIFFIVK